MQIADTGREARFDETTPGYLLGAMNDGRDHDFEIAQ